MIPIIRKQNMPTGAIFSLLLALTIHKTLTTDVSPTVVTPETSSPPASPATPGPPERGNYNVTNSTDTVCLLARMGLQLNISFTSSSHGKTVQEVLNLHPNLIKVSGSCTSDFATLKLTEDNITLTFSFSLIADTGCRNTTLNYMVGTLGHSYMCQKEKTLSVSQDFSLNTFQLQVQPFGVNGDFGAAEECELDEDDMLIPIIVGAALAVLVLIVILAYLIGRNRSHAGYQTI
ncbi:Lysosome-associated membrane glycoprotein 1 [Anabarilius grahami]|uniref:Lysosome-associated membrane glycoprotein 1 n=1 Tax=Anabarilius grahami TaxID=495550 RepID=A0A3N0Y8C0_ANAGA|nr:Lysosome-associated membrane glycoprotein 1 [Anabarilius grahami]